MGSLIEKRKKDIARTLAELEKYQSYLNLNEQLFKVLDNRPCQELETSHESYVWDKTSGGVYFYYVVPAFRDLMPVLEFFERVCGELDWRSYDENGSRIYQGSSEDFELNFTLTATPDEKSETATCRKVLVGEDVKTETTRTPRYELRCD